MSLPDVLYTLLIGPLETAFEVIFTVAFKIAGNPGVSIIILSLIMNLLLMPMYKQTDAIQLEAIETEKKLKPFVSHIKKTFRGDERFMMLQACYREHHYRPTDAIKGVSPLLLEIPFFMAAYHFLSHLGILNGAAFGPIADLGAPDGMLTLGTVTIHVLPVIMTLINIASSAIYTKDAPFQTKLQLYGMAALFLVLLYNSPAGLALYWTLNNLFSLVKNLLGKLKKPGLTVSILASAAGLGAMVYVIAVHPMITPKKQAFALALLTLLQMPLLVYLVRRRVRFPAARAITGGEKRAFFLGAVFLTIFLGALIPSAVIHASPTEFMDRTTQLNPLLFVLEAFLLAAGTFLIWLSVFYTLLKPAGKRAITLAVWLACGVGAVDYMFFGADYGTLLPTLQYMNPPEFGRVLLNLGAVGAVCLVGLLVWNRRRNLISAACGVLSIAVAVMTLLNGAGIQRIYTQTVAALGDTPQEEKLLTLDRDGKNVVVLMLDRAIGSYVPFILNEKPELQAQFAGFTYYPNTMSYGGYTNVGTPPLYGGYDYTPKKMNARAEESLASKQNEALRVMPYLFDDNGFRVTVCDPTYAGYRMIPDLSIYEQRPDIAAHITMGRHNQGMQAGLEGQKPGRNFFCYSIFRAAPVALQEPLYDRGCYNSPTAALSTQYRSGILKAQGVGKTFLDSYNVLRKLPDLTRIVRSGEGTFTMMSNDTTHEPMILKLPEYEPAMEVDNTQYEAEFAHLRTAGGYQLKLETELQTIHYHADMAAMLQLGKWFDYMRENGLYDNTRIILVSDHGDPLHSYPYEKTCVGDEYGAGDIMRYNPLLMVKDFGSTEFTTDMQFMTNADVPELAMEDLIEDPINPFTGNPINQADKEGEQFILFTEWNVEYNNGNTFQPGRWYSVHDNVFDIRNWKYLGE